MRSEDTKNISIFLTHMEMFIPLIEKTNVVSYIHGYEGGSLGECKFTELLSERIEIKHSIKATGTGWPGQIESHASINKMDWMASFCLLATETLTNK